LQHYFYVFYLVTSFEHLDQKSHVGSHNYVHIRVKKIVTNYIENLPVKLKYLDILDICLSQKFAISLYYEISRSDVESK